MDRRRLESTLGCLNNVADPSPLNPVSKACAIVALPENRLKRRGTSRKSGFSGSFTGL
jgi:hypothetical protein